MINFPTDKVVEFLHKHYKLKGTLTELHGYEEKNYLLESESGKYICKISDETMDPHFLDAQVCVLRRLSETGMAPYFQAHLRNKSGTEVTALQSGDLTCHLRVLTYLEGTFWVEREKPAEDLLLSLGRFLGRMDKALSGFSHPALHRDFEWDIAMTPLAEDDLRFIRDPEKRRLAAYFMQQYRTEVEPAMKRLRKACIHNDCNDYNLLTHENEVCGLIDFGDMVYSTLVNNLAVACTYAMFRQDDILKAASLVIKAYHKEYPLLPGEVSLIYYLIAARLCISVTRSARHSAMESSNVHHFVTEKNAWSLLFKLLKINPEAVRVQFFAACGFETGDHGDHSYGQLLSARRTHLGRNLSLAYAEPLKIVRGALQYLYDDRGNSFVDCVNNVAHVGHCHPVVVNAIQCQAARLNTNTRYLHDNILEYAAGLKATLPSRLKVCYFTNSGSEAVDLAIRISRHYKEQRDVIVLDHAYHGTTATAMELSPYKFDGPGGSGKKPYIHKAMNPDLFRGPYRYNDSEAGKKYAADVQHIVKRLTEQGKKPAAFICESLQGVGGQHPLPEDYLREVYRYVRQAGGICIADEVQCGFGRVGSAFWGFELQGVEPDIVVFGKPAGNGHPLAGMVITEEIADRFNNGMEYFNTYGGNPVAMAAGSAVMKVIRDEELQANALETGSFLLDGLKKLALKYPLLGDVRGSGLFIGVEVVKDHQTLKPALQEINFMVEEMKNRGFLLGTDGPLHNVIKIKPPMVFSRENAVNLLARLDEVIGRCEKYSIPHDV